MSYKYSKELLLEILKTGGVLSVSLLAPNAAQALKPLIGNRREDKKKFRSTINRMEQNGLIGIREKDGILTLTLKREGRIIALKYDIDNLAIPTPKKWDKRWSLVIFDIPEKYKVARNVLKNKLDDLGFKQI